MSFKVELMPDDDSLSPKALDMVGLIQEISDQGAIDALYQELDIKRVINIAFSGRFYMDRDTWRGFNYTYGHTYYQWSQGFGTGANPAYNTTNSKGIKVTRDSVLKKIIMVVDRNNSENAPFDINLSVIRNGTIVDVTTVTNTTYTTNNVEHVIEPDFALLEGDAIMMAGRKVGGAGNRRYAQTTVTLDMEVS